MLEIDATFLPARIGGTLVSLKKGGYADAISPRELLSDHRAKAARVRTDEAIRQLRQLLEIAPNDKLTR